MVDIHKFIQFPERFWKKLHSQALILLYHRVATLETDPQLLSVTPEHFAEHLEYLSEHDNVISLFELYQALKTGKIPDKSVIITFDDGYGDNLWNAKPLLEKYSVPATIFVTSGYVGSDREFWCDELEQILLLTDQLPDQLELTIKGMVLKWDLSRKRNNSSQNGCETSLKSWNVNLPSDPGPTYTVYRDLHRLLKPMNPEQQESILSFLAKWAGISRTVRTTHRPLTVDELKRLDHGELVEIGSHTLSHIMLSMQPINVQKEEIVQSKIMLERIIGHEVQSFSYPYGGDVDFNNDTIEKVREAGFAIACANYASTIIRTADPYRLPRVLVRDWNTEFFSLKMKEWFND